MWIRSAFWVGSIKPGSEARFRAGIDGDMIPSLKALPGVRDAKALWPKKLDDEPPLIGCQILVEFADRAALERMLASAERRTLRGRVGELAALFDGKLSHIDYEVGE
jgi:antibiotic biosynthesis monooxygenase (ABM) superfamily enzyme